MVKDRVLFVCTDGARSQMAAAILREHAADRFEVGFAATSAEAVSSLTREALRQHDLHGTDLRSMAVDDASTWPARYIVRLDEGAAAPKGAPAAQSLDWEFPDPAKTGGLAAYEEDCDQIEATIFDWLTKFEERDDAESESLRAHHLAGPRAFGGARNA